MSRRSGSVRLQPDRGDGPPKGGHYRDGRIEHVGRMVRSGSWRRSLTDPPYLTDRQREPVVSVVMKFGGTSVADPDASTV